MKSSDDSFRPKLGRPRSKGGKAPRFISRVLKAASKAGSVANSGLAANRARGAKRGRGHAVAKLLNQPSNPSARRVAVKTRLVHLKHAAVGSVAEHLRYIERDGVTPDGKPGQAYGPLHDTVDPSEFEARGAGDRHQFRFIVSPEDGAEFGDLKPFTRDLMSQMERDLGTRLDWVAVDHWDTGHPHTHIVLRGVADNGENLVIARDYIAHGMRIRAREIMTRSLGPRTQQEIEASLMREVTQDRWTGLDSVIQREIHDGIVNLRDLSAASHERPGRAHLIGRMGHLETLGLADRVDGGTWTLSPRWEETLRSLGERGDIIRTMQRTFGQERRESVVFDSHGTSPPVIGRITGKGLHDEFGDRSYLIVDAMDGKVHYVALPAAARLSDLPVGGIVEVRGASPRAADRTIAALAENGIYRTEKHLATAQAEMKATRDPQAFVESHVRRLEALRRGGLVERIENGVWRIPTDLAEQGRRFDAQRSGGVQVELKSNLAIERQVRTIGATWLDQQLVGTRALPATSFGSEVKAALAQREDFLATEGLARRAGGRVILAQNLLATLRAREIDATARSIEAQSGLLHRPVTEGHAVSGMYRRSIQLASGRFAMLDDGVGFSLVPWRPVIEQRLGQSLSAVVRGGFVSWEFGRSRGPSR